MEAWRKRYTVELLNDVILYYAKLVEFRRWTTSGFLLKLLRIWPESTAERNCRLLLGKKIALKYTKGQKFEKKIQLSVISLLLVTSLWFLLPKRPAPTNWIRPRRKSPNRPRLFSSRLPLWRQGFLKDQIFLKEIKFRSSKSLRQFWCARTISNWSNSNWLAEIQKEMERVWFWNKVRIFEKTFLGNDHFLN